MPPPRAVPVTAQSRRLWGSVPGVHSSAGLCGSCLWSPQCRSPGKRIKTIPDGMAAISDKTISNLNLKYTHKNNQFKMKTLALTSALYAGKRTEIADI